MNDAAQARRQAIYGAVRRIPRGKVATYGQVARAARLAGRARLVGSVLRDCPPHEKLAWHRVVNASGRVSRHPDPSSPRRQRALLESEGVRFSPSGVIDLARFQWRLAADPAAESFRRSG